MALAFFNASALTIGLFVLGPGNGNGATSTGRAPHKTDG